MIQEIHENLYRLEIPLPRSPLKTLNCYVMRAEARSLIVDTGYNLPECIEALRAGIRELGLDMNKTDVLATHFHADHTGLISQIISESSKVYMGRVDAEMFTQTMLHPDDYWSVAEENFRLEGYPEQELAATRLANPARKFRSESVFDSVPLDEGDELAYGGMVWKVVSTPGHTPGHICLYEETLKMLVSGDHILFDITPNIAWWKQMRDSLGSYMGSLEKLYALDVERVLPGHRGLEGSLSGRIRELLAHHEARLCDVMELVRDGAPITAYDIAARMKWAIRAKDWADFPPGQRWFAVGEAIAHIQHLLLAGKLACERADGVNRYSIKD